MKRRIPLIACLSLSLAALHAAEPGRPLFENSWSNPQFVSRFLGTYGFDSGLNPGISAEEKALFEKLVPVIQSQPANAITQLRAAIKPTSSGALDFTLGNLLFQTGNLDEAAAAYQAALQKFPTFLRAHKNIGRLYVQQGRPRDALPHLLRCIELGGGEGDIYGLVGYCYLQDNAVSSALDAYRTALLFAPKSRDWRLGKVQCLINLGQHGEAVGLLDELISENPAEASLWLLQANAFVANGRPADAAVNLEVVRQMGQATPISLALLGDIYINANQPDLAVEAYSDLLKGQTTDMERALRAARILASRSAWAEAEVYLKRLQERLTDRLPPNDQFEVLGLLAKVALARGQNDEAASLLQQVLARDPLNGRALLLLADYYWKKNDRERAELHFVRAANVEDVRVEALIQHARLCVAHRDFAAASRLLNRAQGLQPQPHVGDFLAKVEAAARAARL
ncbi:MAG: tetratricopeptide repeat protein [Verrucomicrobiae bacterium]|nr:tetratricopeptide repeat protein [Verrucomicrobiae bacterium]